MKTLLKALILLGSLSPFLSAATTCSGTTANCSYGVSASELADKIQGIGITITNPVITHGGAKQVGLFSNGVDGANLEIDEGIILTGMNVQESFTTNSNWKTSITESGTYNDPDLRAIDTDAIYNPVIFEFDVTLDANTRLLLIDYQFASDEYNEYVGSQFNDAFGFFISGGDLSQTYNIARVVDNQTYVTVNDINNYAPVTVNNVNNGSVGDYDDATPQILTNSSYFIDNCDKDNGGPNCTQNKPPVDVEYDGITHTLHATLDNLTPGETYHFKMALADTSDSLWDTGVFVNKINGLREPSLCYDYAYKQNGSYLTAGFDPNQGPYLEASGIPNDPIEVAMYIKNTKDSEITTSNISVDILDINTTQATYVPGSVSVTDPGYLVEDPKNDADLNITSNSIGEIPIASFNAFEFFYIYFSLDPQLSNLSLPINARIAYDLTIPLSATQSLTINRTSFIDQDIPICGGGSTEFNVTYGLFNVIENNYYTDSTTYNYNINTQVVNRDPQLSVVAVDANSTDLHDLQSITTVVGIDILDLKSFHDIGATCSESKNTLSDDRIWVVFDNDSITPLDTNGTNLFAKAAETAALRIAYFDDGNGSILQLEKVEKNGEARWNVVNFSDAVKAGNCLADIANGTDTVAQWCSNAGTSFNSAMTKQDLDICLKCVYGYNTNLVCARDNFAVRPEAFMIHIDDQNQTSNPGIRLTSDMTGLTSPGTNHIDLAAGYSYNLDINATNHKTNEASDGYSAIFNDTAGATASFQWSPRAGKDVTGCNDPLDHNNTVKMWAGTSYDSNASIDQVGDYMLHLEDTSWTTVDSTPPTHHSLAYFLSGSDCVVDSSYAATTSEADSLNGCNISSSHTNGENSTKYKDINITFHPYQFDFINSVTIGENNQTTAEQPFIYMANLSDNKNISAHLDTRIFAHGPDGATALSNYVTQCFSEPTVFQISKSETNSTQLRLRYSLEDLNATGSQVGTDINGTVAMGLSGVADQNVTFTLPETFWTKLLYGSLRVVTYVNFDKNVSQPINPEDINYTRLDINESTNTFTADLNTSNYAEGNQTVGEVVHYYYGKTVAPKVTVLCNTTPCTTGNDVSNMHKTKVLVYYSIYCNPRDPGMICSPGNTVNDNLPLNSIQTNDIRWWTNPYHDLNIVSGVVIPDRDGIIGTVSQVNYNDVNETNRISSNNFTYETQLQYDGSNSLPYDATMQMQSSPWLIFDENNESAISNQFTVEFMGDSGWSGLHEEESTTDTKIAPATNRRIMW